MSKKKLLVTYIIVLTMVFSVAVAAQDSCQGNACNTVTDCASGEMCDNGCCAPAPNPCLVPCTIAEDCGVDQSCVNSCCSPNACQTTCDESTPCTIDHTCTSGCCTPIACSQNSDCPEPVCPAPAGISPNVFFPLQCNMCQSGFCIDPPPPTCGTPGCSCTGDSGCSDGLKCTIDTCVSGGCVFTPKNCADAFACTTDSCSTSSGNCVNTEVDSTCDDGIACTDDKCSKNSGCSNTAKDNLCDDGLQCTSDTCDAQASGCVFGCADTDGDGICD